MALHIPAAAVGKHLMWVNISRWPLQPLGGMGVAPGVPWWVLQDGLPGHKGWKM